MGTRALPDMYALSPRTSGIHIRQITDAQVITIACFMKIYGRSSIHNLYFHAVFDSLKILWFGLSVSNFFIWL